MGKPTGFLEFPRQRNPLRDKHERVLDYYEIYTPPNKKHLMLQGSRCMDCGVPFCGSEHGCPIGNLIPEWNDLIHEGRWQDALDLLSETNNFPEFTGRVCPAPCEGSCVLGINEPAVTIKDIENSIIDIGFEKGWVQSKQPSFRTGRSIAIIGSGPAGLTAADQLNKTGHQVTVFEREDRVGGLLMYGIPNMKLSKSLINRRIELLEDSGITFKTNTDVGIDVDCQEITKKFDAILLATGSTVPHDLSIPGRELDGIYFAMEFLTQHTKSLLKSALSDNTYINTNNKNVIVIGGGDTGTDCIATAIRQGCKSIVNIELLPKPPQFRDKSNPWPLWPNILRTDYGHEEAIAIFGDDPRVYETSSNSFIDNGNGEVLGLESQSVAWNKKNGQWSMKKIKGTETQWDADIVLLAMGFSGPEKDLPEKFGVDLNKQANIAASYESFATNKTGIFSAGDCRRGQSLVVWAMNEGRGVALAINTFLQNKKK